VNLETINTIASVGTLVVIAATAIAALGQLRHSRSSNQIIALTECREVLESEEFARALLFVRRRLPELMKDAGVRARLAVLPLDEDLRAVTVVGNFFESMGSFVKHDIIDAEIACDLWAGLVVDVWDAMNPALFILRSVGGPAAWEGFEYLTAVSKRWIAHHKEGSYPKGLSRLPVVEWREIQTQVAEKAAQSR
jgi:hypothetical protein